MSFPPRFLDEIRARVACSAVIGRRVRLIKRNREHAGLCPFHNEKTPSFTVNDDKGFFHCFGCGAHGDVIGFVMRIDHLSFPEAVERLAEEAGLELPRQTPEQAAREERAKSLGDAMEAAAKWFEQQLRAPAGRNALDYLQRQRGLDDATIARFRLGYAPEDRQALRRALKAQGFDDNMLIEASLLVLPEGGGEPFSFFRDRVMFAVADRRGRVIAFGGRVMGDAKPKYINSRDTPLFDKGRSLYALDKAWEGVRGAAELVVAEGYMDVIALHAAGFKGAVAPLGTALTETQIELLWRMAPEPILCLDGDEAGQRAALRAAERALPLLKPGHSLRFATLPAGEDPDSLIRRDGAPALAALLGRTRPLADVLWENAIATRSLATPEQRAALEDALEGLAAKIANRPVQWQYRRLFRSRLRAQFWTGPPARQDRGGEGGRGAWREGGRDRGRGWGHQRPPGLRAAHVPPTVDLTSAQVILCTLINHVDILAVQEVFDQVETLHFVDRRLDQLLHDLLLVAAQDGPLHPDRLIERLAVDGHGEVLGLVDRPDVMLHAPFARTGASFDEALGGLSAFLRGLHVRDLRRDLAQAEERLGQAMTPENWEVVQTLRRLIEEEEAAAEQSDLFETVPGLPRA
jgi:DNA primase